MKVDTILAQVDLGSLALPEFQRGYVWNRDQVRGLMGSLYRKHPVGGLLVWETKTDNAPIRGGDAPAPGGHVDLLLDGQQRVTTLYGIMRGKPPAFFEGNAQTLSGLHFNLADETFEFYSGQKMHGNPLWIDVTDLMQRGIGEFVQRIVADPALAPELTTYLGRLNAVDQIGATDFHIDRVTGEDKTVDVVVDIFNRVNSGGTKLTKGDLALAKICAGWPDARAEMKQRLEKWRSVGFGFKLELYLRVINALVTGDSRFEAMAYISTLEFQNGLVRAEKHIDTLLNLISSRLGLDSDDVLGSKYAFAVMAKLLDERSGKHLDEIEREKLLYWYIHTMLWGRYAGSTETIMNADLEAIKQPSTALNRLIDVLRRSRGDLRLRPDDFLGWSRGSRFYPFLYMMTRVDHTRDFDSGVELRNALLGSLSSLQMHHIFPRALLYKHGYGRPEANAIANFTFLTQETNLLVSDRNPVEYLAAFENKNPGVLASHWIPQDPDLWKVENYEAFLSERRRLLADAANEFLNSLYSGQADDAQIAVPALDRPVPVLPGGVATEDERLVLLQINEWITSAGLPEGTFSYELIDPHSGEPVAILDIAWPDGLQEGLSPPAALLLDEPEQAIVQANAAGFRCFTSVDAFRAYVMEDVLALHSAAY